MERLAGAILLKAVEDWDDPRNRSEIDDFLDSPFFEAITDLLGLDPQDIRLQLRTGKYQRLNMRAAYR
jgi:hypothetical protein